MDGRFPFYYAPGFPSQNVRHFDHTLAGPSLDQAGLSGILLNQSDSPASVVSVVTTSPAPLTTMPSGISFEVFLTF